ncbi:MAG: DEAD/DEAH box helicase, partial [Paracoccaceae bacterium]
MIQLRDYQRAAIDALWDYFRSGAGGNPIVACPTGAGKSVIQAVFLEEALTQFPTTRVLCATHVGELVQQNAMGIRKNWPQVPMGIYAAGLGQRNLGQQVTVASIQSIYKRAAALGKVDLLMIDEAQLISRKGEGMYRKLIDALMETNPMMKVIGLTATPYRMDSGSLIDPEEGTIFTDLCYDIELGFLVEQGYLSPLQSKKPTAVFDLSDLKPKTRGDWTESDLSEVVDTDKNNGPAVAEMYQLAHDRKKWLVFAVNVAHAHNLNRLISAGGRKSRVIEGSMDKATRAQYIAMYQRGELDCL